MYKILIWGCGLQYGWYINAIRYHELKQSIKVVGITGKDEIYHCLDGYPFIPLKELNNYTFDYIVVTSEKYYENICEEAELLGFSREKIIQGKVFCLPSFHFEKYVQLIQSRVSIIANNCWGGTAYHALGMRFLSPFINMFLNDADYIRLLRNLKYYLGLKLRFVQEGYNPVLERTYPVCRLDDVELHFNHYINMQEVEEKWYGRIRRLNWENLFIMMFTENHRIMEDFDALPYQKKICFAPFKSPEKSAFYFQLIDHEEMQSYPFWEIVNKTASGYFHEYDLIELLNTGMVNHDRYYLEEK
ncbi:MAG: DUF1919 domain-containing protein [Lachnospiraceae bacterium]|jgi:uncharacterized protein (DUF1919 family)|nr:DUF1919 domain-containing protein [Lachnospiraceae bacterium]